MGRPGLTIHRKFRRLERALGSRMMARGALELLWETCYESGDDYVGTAADIEQLAGWTGEPGVLTRALVAAGAPEGAGFIEPSEPGETGAQAGYRVHDLWHHAPEYVAARHARERERKKPKRCHRCGTTYFKNDPRSQYCSDLCRKGDWRDRQPREPDADSNEEPHGSDRNAPSPETERDGSRRSVPSRETEGDGTPAPAPAPTPTPAPAQGEEKSVCSETLARSEPPPSKQPRELVPMAESSTEVVLMSFPVDGPKGKKNGAMGQWPLTQRRVDEWAESYQTLDIVDESRRARAWVMANPQNQKTYDGMPSFLNRWFARAVNTRRAGAPVITGSLKTAGNKAALAQFLERRGHVVE